MTEAALRTVPLRRHPEVCGTLATWFEQEWPDWYGPGGRGDARADLDAFANAAGVLPVGVVALAADGSPLGVAALKPASIASHAHLAPWAAAGLVRPGHRGRGIGAGLLAALLDEARRLGYARVYCGTATSATLLQREGWQLLETVEHDGQRIGIFSRDTPPG